MTPGLGRSSGERNSTPLQYSCLENPMNEGAWWATVRGVAKSQTQLSDFTSLHQTIISAHTQDCHLGEIKIKSALKQKQLS